MKNRVFLDTAFVVALSIETDIFHEKALGLSDEIEAREIHLITTRAVLLEIGNSLARNIFRKTAVDVLAALEVDKNVTIVPFTEELYQAACQLYRSRMDKEWGLIDCVSFVTMQELNLTEALTTDRHFEQAGFKPLMR